MAAGTEKNQLIPVGWVPNQQPVRFDVTFPVAGHGAGQSVGPMADVQGTLGQEFFHNVLDFPRSFPRLWARRISLLHCAVMVRHTSHSKSAMRSSKLAYVVRPSRSRA